MSFYLLLLIYLSIWFLLLSSHILKVNTWAWSWTRSGCGSSSTSKEASHDQSLLEARSGCCHNFWRRGGGVGSWGSGGSGGKVGTDAKRMKPWYHCGTIFQCWSSTKLLFDATQFVLGFGWQSMGIEIHYQICLLCIDLIFLRPEGAPDVSLESSGMWPAE